MTCPLDKRFDLIVVGGGIHGLMIALFATETGQRTLLLERGQVGGGTTAGWFGILHGGLRYLQALDVRRFRESLADSRWFLRAFPDLVVRQPFLMPLYGHGLKRPEVLRAAFLVERALGPDRNRGVLPAQAIPPGRVLSAREVVATFPAVSRDGLAGGALWEELVVPDGAALIAALADRGRRAGLAIGEGTEVTGLLVEDGRAAGATSGGESWRAPVVVNAGGAWSWELARRLAPTLAEPLGHPALAFNLLLDRPPPATTGLALTPPGGESSMIFVYPAAGRTFAGTAYLPHQGPADIAEVPEAAIGAFLARIEAAIPGFGAGRKDVISVTSGLLPATGPGSVDLLDRAVICDHGAAGGPKGLFSLWGVKYTTAPSVARRVLRQSLPR